MTVVADELLHIHTHAYEFWKISSFVYSLQNFHSNVIILYTFLPFSNLPVPDSTQIVSLNGLSFFLHTIFMVVLSSSSVLC